MEKIDEYDGGAYFARIKAGSGTAFLYDRADNSITLGIDRRLLSRTFVAEGAIAPHRIVRYGTIDGRVRQAFSPTGPYAGVYVGETAVADGEPVEVCVLGEAMIQVVGAVTAGATLSADPEGRGTVANPPGSQNIKTVGVAMESGGDEVLLVLVVPGWFQG